MQRIMQRAGKIVLDGFTIRSDVDKVVYPDRYMDEGGAAMWDLVMEVGGLREKPPRWVGGTTALLPGLS
jgi:hypothetical protein